MDTTPRKLLTIVAEKALESELVDELRAAGARGYTVFDARGSGAHGDRPGDWDENRNICVMVVCDEASLERVLARLDSDYLQDWALAFWVSEVAVRRGDKYS